LISCSKEPIEPIYTYSDYGYIAITNNRDSVVYIELATSTNRIHIGYEYQINEIHTYYLPEKTYYLNDIELNVTRQDTLFYVMQ